MTVPNLAVVHVTDDMAPLSGGVPAVVRQLTARLSASGALVQVVHATGDAQDVSAPAQASLCQPNAVGKAWYYGPALRPTLAAAMARHAQRQRVVHIHGVWASPQYFAARIAYSRRLPFVFTAHGMLEPWLWDQQGWRVRAKKAAYWKLLAAPALRNATVVHAITPLERDHLHRLLPCRRIEVIPNAIEISPVPEVALPRERKVLFLGRIEPKKGVDILIRAFAAANLASDWTLQIAGPSWSPAYMRSLVRLVREAGVGSRVQFSGPAFGAQKRQLLESSWVMAVPSHSEVVGLVNLEAGERQLPTITTHQTGLSDWQQGGGLLVQPELASVAAALRQSCGWSDAERDERGWSSRELIERRYSWHVVTEKWQRLYIEIAQGNN